jgi:probable HAF family extracellular repeat protein
MKRISRRFAWLILILASPAGAVPPRYQAIDLGAFTPNGYSQAYALNAHNQVVGFSNNSSGTARAFRWENGVMTDLGTFGGESAAYGINDAGHVVGYSQVGATTIRNAFLYSGGTMTNIGTLGGDESLAYDINNAGQITGYSNQPVPPFGSPVRPFIYQGGSMIGLGTISGIAAQSVGRAINENGEVVGYSQGPPALVGHHAFLYSAGVMTDIGSPGVDFNEAWDVNDHGVAVGGDFIGGGYHAVMFQSGTVIDLGVVASDPNSVAVAINNLGQVVGESNSGAGLAMRAFLYDGGVMYDLNDLLEPASASAWHLLDAYDINLRGYIVGSGMINGQRHGYLLVPAPEPGAIQIVAALGAAMILAKRPRPRSSPAA